MAARSVTDASGNALYAQPYMQFQYGAQGSVVTPCLAATVFNPGVTVPCVNGTQTWRGYQFPGLITQHPTGTEDYSVAGKWQVPINFHIGSMGLAPPAPTLVDSVPPTVYGGNLDDRRVGVGATMYYKVGVAGGLLSMGDAHTAQGDSELDGTGIETSITGDFRITLIKANATPAFLKGAPPPAPAARALPLQSSGRRRFAGRSGHRRSSWAAAMRATPQQPAAARARGAPAGEEPRLAAVPLPPALLPPCATTRRELPAAGERQ